MPDRNLHIRGATPDDAADLARFVNMAGEGLPHYLWSGMAGPGEDAWSIGSSRARREEGGFSYRNSTLAIHENSVAGCLIGYPLDSNPEVIVPDTVPAMFLPLMQLEALAAGTWYINVLAVYPQFRGIAIGAGLLSIAEVKADENGCEGLSLIVSDSNTAAIRLYQRCGYQQRASKPMVKDSWSNAGENWVLMIKE